MTPTRFCGLSSYVGNALIAGAGEQILKSPPIVQKCPLTIHSVLYLVPATKPKQPSEIKEYKQLQTTPLVNTRLALQLTSSEMEQLVAQHNQHFKNRMDKVDEVDKGTRAAEENQRHIETEVLDELAVDAVDTSVAFEQQLRESSLRDVVLKMKQFLKQSSILMPTLPKSDAPQPFLLLARPKLESMLSSTTNLEKTLPQKSATTTRPTTAIEAAVPADDGRKAEKQTSDSHDKLKLSRQTQKLRKEEVK
ncbi:hypothetical protein BLNAU_3198 [Blattamonas nauphoetae]|uniref:Uncharacterized protein n=1 Tax=Blattamonas nauphoetae TaxID=2049346 RepID=A0ABQ9X1V3_9EUKA|nr:hypothetical protein BLNAU_20150 [Blattamonas nauphoetae]KAK2961761.1 hypothetical protein BLNAU_3198 [Blattamonas nauphoetae]